VLVFSALDETIYAERMLSVGANGYLMKRAAPEQLVQALRQVLEGKHYVSPEIGDSILRHYAGGSSQPLARPLERLTNRELQVMHMIAEGMTTRRMAALLHLSVKTVESHRQRIKRKLNLDSGVQLVRFAVTILSAVGESRPGETVDRAIEPAAVEDD
jgi:DNA-binding NarL/FixJ family response regulator